MLMEFLNIFYSNPKEKKSYFLFACNHISMQAVRYRYMQPYSIRFLFSALDGSLAVPKIKIRQQQCKNMCVGINCAMDGIHITHAAQVTKLHFLLPIPFQLAHIPTWTRKKNAKTFVESKEKARESSHDFVWLLASRFCSFSVFVAHWIS